MAVERVERVMEYIKVTNENIDKEHICCAISNNNDIQVSSKKEWLKEQFREGLVFLKSAERGKCFIEYLPAENAWNPIVADAPLPEFKECARHPHVEEKGYVLYYTSQCPFNAKYVPIIEEVARQNGVSFRAIHLQSKEEAQNAPTPVTTYVLFYDGAYLTNEQMNDKKFLKLLSK